MSEKKVDEESKKQFGARATAKFNGDFYCIETDSGYSSSATDPEGAQHLLPSDSSDEVLGAAVLDALSKSRFLSLDEIGIFFDRDNLAKLYKAWIQDLMSRYGYKTKGPLFKQMKSVGIQNVEGLLTLRPSHHERPEAWSGTGKNGADHVKLPATSTPEEIGAALRLAFSRCTGA